MGDSRLAVSAIVVVVIILTVVSVVFASDLGDTREALSTSEASYIDLSAQLEESQEYAARLEEALEAQFDALDRLSDEYTAMESALDGRIDELTRQLSRAEREINELAEEHEEGRGEFIGTNIDVRFVLAHGMRALEMSGRVYVADTLCRVQGMIRAITDSDGDLLNHETVPIEYVIDEVLDSVDWGEDGRPELEAAKIGAGVGVRFSYEFEYSDGLTGYAAACVLRGSGGDYLIELEGLKANEVELERRLGEIIEAMEFL